MSETETSTRSIFSPKKASTIKRLGAYLIDAILFITLFAGMVLLVSYIVGYQNNYSLLESKYIEHGVYILKNNTYTFCDETTDLCKQAWIDFNNDKDACYYYDHSTSLTTLIITISAFISYGILEFVMPMIFKNGQTIGMKCFKIGLIDKQGIRVKNIQIFIRFLFGKFLVSRILPVYGFIFMVFNLTGGLYGFVLAVGILLCDLAMMIFSKTKSGIANAISSTYAVDLEETYIFNTIEELNDKKCEEQRILDSKKKIY